MKKSIIAILLALSVLFSTGISVYAYDGENTVSPYYLYTYSVKSTLVISGNTAYCESKITGNCCQLERFSKRKFACNEQQQGQS